MIFIPILALIVGVLLGRLWAEPVKGEEGQYIAIACIAGLDSILGAIRAGLEGKFYNDVFITGFVSNVLIAFFLAWLGDKIGINLFLAAALILGTRIFTNLSLIRRYVLTKITEARQRKARQQQANQP